MATIGVLLSAYRGYLRTVHAKNLNLRHQGFATDTSLLQLEMGGSFGPSAL